MEVLVTDIGEPVSRLLQSNLPGEHEFRPVVLKANRTWTGNAQKATGYVIPAWTFVQGSALASRRWDELVKDPRVVVELTLLEERAVPATAVTYDDELRRVAAGFSNDGAAWRAAIASRWYRPMPDGTYLDVDLNRAISRNAVESLARRGATPVDP